MTTRSESTTRPPRLHINPAHVDRLLSDSTIQEAVSAIHLAALDAGGDGVNAFLLLVTALGEFISLTDAPIDLATLAIEQLTEERDELIADGHEPGLALATAPEDEVTA